MSTIKSLKPGDRVPITTRCTWPVESDKNGGYYYTPTVPYEYIDVKIHIDIFEDDQPEPLPHEVLKRIIKRKLSPPENPKVNDPSP